jgi:hypothetical protein
MPKTQLFVELQNLSPTMHYACKVFEHDNSKLHKLLIENRNLPQYSRLQAFFT